MDLDPKGANNQIKEVIDKQYANDDEEVVVHLDPTDTASSNSRVSSDGRTSRHHRSNSSMEADDGINAEAEAMLDDST